MNEPKAIDIDLPRDLGELFRDRLVQLGYDATGLDEPTKMIRTYLKVSRRLISVQPRKILKAKNFVCPPSHIQGLSKIESTIQSGGDLTPYLSEKIVHRDFQDQLLLHWGVYHLHLGTQMQSNGFMGRTKHLLFCRFDHEHGYFIDVLPHGVWTKRSLVTIVHDNWPDSIEKFRLHGVEGDSLGEKRIRNLRKRNMNFCIELKDGDVYAPLGGGVTCSGDNILDVMEADRLLYWAKDKQSKITIDLEKIRKRARDRGFVFAVPARFKLYLEGETFFAVEVCSRYMLPLAFP